MPCFGANRSLLNSVLSCCKRSCTVGKRKVDLLRTKGYRLFLPVLAPIHCSSLTPRTVQHRPRQCFAQLLSRNVPLCPNFVQLIDQALHSSHEYLLRIQSRLDTDPRDRTVSPVLWPTSQWGGLGSRHRVSQVPRTGGCS